MWSGTDVVATNALDHALQEGSALLSEQVKRAYQKQRIEEDGAVYG